MERQISKQKRKKDRIRSAGLGRQIPDAPTLEEYECLLGESPTSYPKGEGIENMENELHSAAIDTECYSSETNPLLINIVTENVLESNSSEEIDEVDKPTKPTIATAPNIEDIEATIESGRVILSSLILDESSPTAPIIEDIPQKSLNIQQPTIFIDEAESELLLEAKVKERSVINSEILSPLSEEQLSDLYNNEELNLVEPFINEFIDFQLKSYVIRQQHKLYDLLMSYLRVRNCLLVTAQELKNLQNSCKEIQKQLWYFDKVSVTESGECQDGNPVDATHEYSVAHFKQQTLLTLTKKLSALKELLHNNYALHCYESETLKLQIEYYICRVCISCQDFANLTCDAPVALNHCKAPLHTSLLLVELRMCVTLLFNFQRKTLRDNVFVSDTRGWLTKLISVLLRVATWQDHLFILNHILRCPTGVSNWAKSYIQVPVVTKNKVLQTSPINDPNLDHLIAVLAVILLPIKEREKFLEQVQIGFEDTANSSGDTIWVILDEDGEEDEDILSVGMNLTECDLLTFLQQVPFDNLFEKILFVERNNDSVKQDKTMITDHHLLKAFAFSTAAVKIIKKGMKTYDSPRYRQLVKRLSALIRDFVQFTSDLWESFDKSKVTNDAMLSRLQTEYDYFFLRATLCIFSSKRLGAWQYLAAAPYHLISTNSLWQLFYLLHTESTSCEVINHKSPAEWEAELNCSNLRKSFEEKLINLPGDESYYLLTTFANMAVARSNQDYDFIRAATIDLFKIGFLCSKTQDSCCKDARSLLSNLTTKYPLLLSDILSKLQDNFLSVGKLSIYLFSELNICHWVPSNEDFKIITSWLQNFSLASSENHLARLILSNLNWESDNSGNLRLSMEVHRFVALLIVKLVAKHAPSTSSLNIPLLSEGVKHVSSIVRQQSNEQNFCLWAWDTVTRLKLHQLEQSDSACQFAMSNPSRAFAAVPDVDSDSSLDVLLTNLREKQPIACYVAMRMTLYGHSVPLICSKGVELMHILHTHYKFEHILIILSDIIPLFLESPESILKNEKFISLISSLINADRTYVKIAKNLISSEFPGPLLKLFANMLEYQLNNANRYCLQSPEPFIKFWLNILVSIPDWNRDQSVTYLMDTLIRASFFHASARKSVNSIFQNLYMNIAAVKNSGSLGSLFNWATGSPQSPTLLGGSIQAIWVAYQILYTEQQEREVKSGLWKELLRELSAQTKTSVDSALKKACVIVKIPLFGASSLAIYRWSQQALDTPMDHPLLPLIWQNFFVLFLSRVLNSTGTADNCGVGDKFFEGLINSNYLKKLKKRLLDTTEHFQTKGEKDLDEDKPIIEERRIFYLNSAKYYKTLSLWLEEPRLQDSGLYLPALPPQYMTEKLVKVLEGDDVPWLEYLDYWIIQKSQANAIADWKRLSFRCYESNMQPDLIPSLLPHFAADPLEKILKGLNTYESVTPPPPLIHENLILNHVQQESLYNSSSIIKLLVQHLKIISEYAQTFNLMVSENTAIDCNFLELVPTLYKDVNNEITLYAICDPASSSVRKVRSGTPPIVHCAGAAVITLKVCESRISDVVDRLIRENRAAYENVIKRASEPPSTKVIESCVFINHLIGLLEHELNINRTSENASILQSIQEAGVELFYHLVNFYDEEISHCLPTKQLITSCLEKLGQLFISDEENQGPRLLKTVMEVPTLGGILGPHFTPVAGGATTFLQMYQTIVEFCVGTNSDLCFVLLTKFDISNWLNYRRPRLSERSTFIELVSRALCIIGFNPEEDKLMLHEIFRNHFRLILLHEFPEHYGEVLSAILRGSESQSLSLDVWRDLLFVLCGRSKTVSPVYSSKVKEEIRKYATEQRLLSRQEIHDTAILLSKHFMNERLQYGLYGLYPKYRMYNEPLTMFFGMIGHALVVLTLQSERGILADQICEKIWPVLSDMFAPWVTPYWSRNLREPTAAWIQQLTDDRSVLLPWIITDGPYANKSVNMFVECIRFILDTMPASGRILCYLWQFYVSNFAHTSIKDHILTVIHGNFLTLPWDRFNPTIMDIELMVRVVDQYLPDCHLFLGSIFTSICWTTCINELISTQSPQVLSRIHIYMLNLLVKLSNEPNVRQNDKTLHLLNEAEKLSWHLVDATSYEQIINWHVMSCDPKVVLCLNEDYAQPIDLAINNLLKIAAGYDPAVRYFHPTTLKKRQIYVRSSVKLLVTCTTRYKSLVTTSVKAFTSALAKMLDDMEAVITCSVPESQQVAEASLLVTELLHSVNQSNILVEQLKASWADWLLKRSSSSPVLLGILRVVCIAVPSPSTLGEIMEAALEAYFKQIVVEEVLPTWATVLNILQPVVPRQPPVESVLVSEGRVLALYAIFLKRLPSCHDIREEGMLLTNLIDWISSIKPMNTNEEKLPLLWIKALELIYRQCQYNDNTVIAARTVKGLAKALLQIADDAGQGWGILGAIGIKKGNQLSVRCKFLSRALGVYCLAQLHESKSDPQQVRFVPHSPGVGYLRNNENTNTDMKPNVDANKAMTVLENLVFNKQYSELKGDIELAISMIRDPGNSLHNAVHLAGTLVSELYSQRYLHIITERETL